MGTGLAKEATALPETENPTALTIPLPTRVLLWVCRLRKVAEVTHALQAPPKLSRPGWCKPQVGKKDHRNPGMKHLGVQVGKGSEQELCGLGN